MKVIEQTDKYIRYEVSYDDWYNKEITLDRFYNHNSDNDNWYIKGLPKSEIDNRPKNVELRLSKNHYNKILSTKKALFDQHVELVYIRFRGFICRNLNNDHKKPVEYLHKQKGMYSNYIDKNAKSTFSWLSYPEGAKIADYVVSTRLKLLPDRNTETVELTFGEFHELYHIDNSKNFIPNLVNANWMAYKESHIAVYGVAFGKLIDWIDQKIKEYENGLWKKYTPIINKDEDITDFEIYDLEEWKNNPSYQNYLIEIEYVRKSRYTQPSKR